MHARNLNASVRPVVCDGGCRTDEATVTRWKAWLEKGFKTNKEAEGGA